MKRPMILSLALLAGAADAGPDLICSQITQGQTYGAVGDYQSYSFGDVTCNIGDAPFTYNANTNDHPVFASTIYRLSDGRFEQIGLGFVAHTFLPLQGNACGLGCNAGGLGMLGDGCSDTITPGLAGGQSNLGPRIEIDPWTGDFAYPFTTINETGDATYKRVKARISDLSDTSALYFIETQYISNEETDADKRNNNASYRRVSFTPASNTPQMQGDTFAQRSVIHAWRDHGLGPDMPDPEVLISSVSLPGDGVVHIGSRSTDLGDGTWRYDYAVQNQNASPGINALRIPLGFNRKVTNPTFHDVDYIDEVDNQIEGTD